MTISIKRDFSMSMLRANLVALGMMVPIFLLLTGVYFLFNGPLSIHADAGFFLFVGVLIVSVVVHELIHAFTAMAFARQPLSSIKFGFNLKTLTPYAHMKAPLEINQYRVVIFLPGLILGIIPYLLSLLLGDGTLLWFGIIHIIAGCGDWLVLWITRNVKAGTMVEDHPTRAGCFVLETHA